VIHLALDNLITRLQHPPPPIDHHQLRLIGRYTDLLTEAVHIGRRIPPPTRTCSHSPNSSGRGFTGGNIAYGPEALRLDATTPDYNALRPLRPLRHADLFHAAHRHLLTVGAAEGATPLGTIIRVPPDRHGTVRLP